MGKKRTYVEVDDYLRFASIIYAIIFLPNSRYLLAHIIFIIILLTYSIARIWYYYLKTKWHFTFLEFGISFISVLLTGNILSPFLPYVLSVIISKPKTISISFLFLLSMFGLLNYGALTNNATRPFLITLNVFLVFFASLLLMSNRKTREEISAYESDESQNNVIDFLIKFHQEIKATITYDDLYMKAMSFFKKYGIESIVLYFYSKEVFEKIESKNGNTVSSNITENITFEPRNPPEILKVNGIIYSQISKLPEIICYIPENDFDEVSSVAIKLGADLISHRIAEIYLSESEKQFINRFTALYTTSQKISSKLEKKEALEIAANAVKQMTGMQKSIVMIVEDANSIEQSFFDPERTVVKGIMEEHPEKIWQKGFFKAAFDCLSNQKPVLASFGNFGITLLSIPIIYQGRVFGVLAGITSLGKAEAKRDLKTMEVIASILSLYLVNTELLKKREELAISQERDRIAKEMHDNLIQSLFSILLLLEVSLKEIESKPESAPEKLITIKERIQSLIKETREMILKLYPQSLTDEGFRSTLERILSNFSGVRINLDLDSLPEGTPLSVENALLRITQEAVSNAVRHSRAENINISLKNIEGELILNIKDDGIGFDPSLINKYLDSKEHFGLSSIVERAKSLGGQAEFDTKPNQGVSITVRIPVNDGKKN
ncbi:MAG: histidine kinase [Actinobacteria bacterium]|nr:histidine kinase [Actinomycetota bacterium]